MIRNNAKLKDGWIVCGYCEKRFEKVDGEFVIKGIERKCPRCGNFNKINLDSRCLDSYQHDEYLVDKDFVIWKVIHIDKDGLGLVETLLEENGSHWRGLVTRDGLANYREDSTNRYIDVKIKTRIEREVR